MHVQSSAYRLSGPRFGNFKDLEGISTGRTAPDLRNAFAGPWFPDRDGNHVQVTPDISEAKAEKTQAPPEEVRSAHPRFGIVETIPRGGQDALPFTLYPHMDKVLTGETKAVGPTRQHASPKRPDQPGTALVDWIELNIAPKLKELPGFESFQPSQIQTLARFLGLLAGQEHFGPDYTYNMLHATRSTLGAFRYSSGTLA